VKLLSDVNSIDAHDCGSYAEDEVTTANHHNKLSTVRVGSIAFLLGLLLVGCLSLVLGGLSGWAWLGAVIGGTLSGVAQSMMRLFGRKVRWGFAAAFGIGLLAMIVYVYREDVALLQTPFINPLLAVLWLLIQIRVPTLISQQWLRRVVSGQS
jgi:hypothetical protein